MSVTPNSTAANPEMPSFGPPDTGAIALAVLPDFREELWPSMDLVAEMLVGSADAASDGRVRATLSLPAYTHRFARLPRCGASGAARNADRLYNRFVSYPRFARSIAQRFDCFHVCDHSYAQLLHALPAGRAGVFCHDLDTFRCVLEPARDPRPKWFRAMAARTLAGLKKARVVFHSTTHVRDELLKFGLVDPENLVRTPYGVSAEYTAHSPPSSRLENETLPDAAAGSFVLHVSSCIPRKRIDVLLDAFAIMHAENNALRLIQVGGRWTEAQRAQIERLRLSGAIEQREGLPRRVLAELYRRARVVLITSESEGFGLPMIEALACGAAVVASDIPPLREGGGDAATYVPVADAEAFARVAMEAVRASPGNTAAVMVRVARASRFTWKRHAEIITGAYEAMMSGENRLAKVMNDPAGGANST